MLVLTRKVREGIAVHDRVTGQYVGRVVVIEDDRGRVRLGFHLPDSLVLNREELLDDPTAVLPESFRSRARWGRAAG